MEELKADGLPISGLCPECNVKVAFHSRQPASPPSPQSKPSSSHRDGSKSVLPKWKADGTTVRSFLERVERTLIADLVDKSHWPRLLLKTVDSNDEGRWIHNNIVSAGVDWNKAKELFSSHFEVFSITEQLRREYEAIKQPPKERVQHYGDRYSSLVEQLGYKDDDPLVIQHFIANFTRDFYAQYMRSIDHAELDTPVNLWFLKLPEGCAATCNASRKKTYLLSLYR